MTAYPGRWFHMRFAVEPLVTLLPGPDLAVRARAAVARQDEVLAQLTSRSGA